MTFDFSAVKLKGLPKEKNLLSCDLRGFTAVFENDLLLK